MNLYLAKKCKYVTGSVNAAIYDLKNNKIYAVNCSGRRIIDKALKTDYDNLTKEEKEYIDKLLKMELFTEIYEEDEEIVYKPKLNFAWLEITEMCNMSCIHCYGKFGAPKYPAENKLNFEDWKRVIDTIKELGCNKIQLIGGEPMVDSDFYRILDYAHEKIKNITVFTNATLINEKNVKELKKYNIKVRVSLYGHNPSVHDNITKHKGSFELTKKALLLLKRENIPTSIAITIMRENEQYINEIQEFVKSIGYKFNGYDVIRPSSVTEKDEHSVRSKKTLEKKYQVSPIFYTSEKDFYRNKQFNSCWNGKISITSEGNIIPCVFSRNTIIGNVKKDNYKTIKNNLIKYWKLTIDKIEECKECEFRYACHDCRPLAIGINGSLYKKNPRCCYSPRNGVWKDIENVTKELLK